MNKRLFFLMITIIGVYSAVSWGQEFLKPKTKYVSMQQDVELDGEIVFAGTTLQGLLIDISKAVFLVIKSSLERVNSHVNGEKNGLSKARRTALHTKKMRIKEAIESFIEEIKKILQRLDECIESFNLEMQAIQSE